MQSVIEALSIDEKRSLLSNLLKQNQSQLQLSVTQERLWQLCQLQPQTPFYNFQTSLELEGLLSASALELAALRVVLRHEILRTSYGMDKGKSALRLSFPQSILIAQYDLSDLPPEEKERRMEAIGAVDVQRSFNLSQPPLFRLTLVHLAPDRHRLFLTMHHIVSDFLSLDLFLFELAEFYSSLIEKRAASLPPLMAQYQDFARAQKDHPSEASGNAHVDYWRRTLADASPMEWFSDHVRPAKATGKAETEFFNIPAGVMHQIEIFARQRQMTPFMVLLSGLNILLHACSGQDDLIVGSPVAGRTRCEYESLIGMFSYPVLMRTNLEGCHDFHALLQKVRQVVLEAAEHGDLPFARVADSAQLSGARQGAILRAMFSFVSRFRTLEFNGLQCRRRPTNRGITDLDLFMTVYPDAGEWHGVLEYSVDLFEQETIRKLVTAYIDILLAAVSEPVQSLASLVSRVPVKPPARLAIAATFTADPLIEVLQFWSRELDLQFTPVIAAYNQLFQQLIDAHSPLFSPANALTVLLVRPEDWVRYADPGFDRQKRLLEQCTQDFITAVRRATIHLSCPLKIYLCPASTQLHASTASLIEAAEQCIRDAFSGVNTVEILNAQICAEKYSAVEIHDPQADLTANIPYTSAFYAALGTALVRQLRGQISRPCKVLVLDCDNTLWQGLCGEDGPQSVVISEGHRALQRFVREQAAAGVLICLNSKNVPEHALAVFHENPGMVLKEADISACRINWEPKSSNLESLAAELQLGLDSFVFLDDDPRECAEVSARCPQVLTFRVPQDPAELPRFLEHLWVFDDKSLSEEDRRRAQFYRDNQRRDSALRQSASLAEFLSTLDLRVAIQSATPDHILRVSQLTQRTNQFNASGLIFTPLELQHLMQQGHKVMTVEVSDRFGEYGLVGAVIFCEQHESIALEAFYLSCRVLGRGVEHRVLSELARIAQVSGLHCLHIHYNQSRRNQPFRLFLDRLPGQLVVNASGPCIFVLSANDALQAKANPEAGPVVAVPDQGTAVLHRPVTARRQAALSRLPHELSTAAQIISQLALSKSTQRNSRMAMPFAAPQVGLESAVAEEWAAILRMDKVGRNDNFFELGGNSLLLVQLNGTLINRLGADISVTEMFQYPTVASLATHISGRTLPDASHEIRTRAAMARAALQERRQHIQQL